MNKTIPTLLLLLSSSINANFNTNYNLKNDFKFNLENLLPKENKIFVTKENPEFKKIYKEYFVNCVEKTYWTEQEAIETLDPFQPGVAIITETDYYKRLFVDGFGKGKYDGIIDLYSEKNMVLEADSLEHSYKNYFKEGLSKTENYFLEDLNYFQNYLLKLIQSQTETKIISSQKDDPDLNENEFLIKTNKYIILISLNTMTINYENKSTYVNYNPIEISETHKKLYSMIELISNKSN